jgi:hypothetical protein
MKWQDRELLQVRQLVSEGDLNETHRVATLRFSCHQNEASVPRTLLGALRHVAGWKRSRKRASASFSISSRRIRSRGSAARMELGIPQR